MRIVITEFKRLFKGGKIFIFWLLSAVYIFVCFLFLNLKFKLDMKYGVDNQLFTGFKLWQDMGAEEYFNFLITVIPGMIYVFSFIDDKKEKIDRRICMDTKNKMYYPVKYFMTVFGGMIYSFITVFGMYFLFYFLLGTYKNGINNIDRVYGYVNPAYKGESAIVLIAFLSLEFAFNGAVFAAIAFSVSLWIDNRVLICIAPYAVFKVISYILPAYSDKEIINVIVGSIDTAMINNNLLTNVLHLLWWIFLTGMISYMGYSCVHEKW